jgi:hypothetical protein
MATEQAIRNRLVAFRVTADEHDLLFRYASDGKQTMTGLLRRLVAESVAGFGSSKRETATAKKEQSK